MPFSYAGGSAGLPAGASVLGVAVTANASPTPSAVTSTVTGDRGDGYRKQHWVPGHYVSDWVPGRRNCHVARMPALEPTAPGNHPADVLVANRRGLSRAAGP
ncbi:hypothetical protein [Streptomyces sp. W1SF4]|uniref:hypothetical protein n=1 Tax=Streptomyces sp. W1SF4 TaxID=2305220 RepID=UPI000F6F0F70|nr:hypothetical protein [Streptomyces sp. W1SF4]AZM93556.1 hypothetical protein D1J60_33910 [Streptomyces sp. W1SF4]